MKKQRKFVVLLLSTIISTMLIFCALITSVEIAAYSDYGFYEKEYEKYAVLDALDMEMDDVIEVTKFMMSYLKGGEEELSIVTEIEGTQQDFFNEQDRFHMEEVQTLFLGGIWLRRLAIGIMLVAFLVLLATDKGWKKSLAKTFEKVLVVFAVAVTVLGVAIAKNFTKCFVIFHEIFFDNDLWIFNSRTDYMIRMLPEGFFFDIVIRIGVIFIVLLAVLLVIFEVLKRLEKKNDK